MSEQLRKRATIVYMRDSVAYGGFFVEDRTTDRCRKPSCADLPTRRLHWRESRVLYIDSNTVEGTNWPENSDKHVAKAATCCVECLRLGRQR
jgi:hypothetical protein